MVEEFSARTIGTQVIEHLERRRETLVESDEAVRAEVKAALAPVRKAYLALDLPAGYVEALEEELGAAIPARWRAIAAPFTRLEQNRFGIWRGGDVTARLTYVLAGLIAGGLLLRVPFLPIVTKWLPFLLAVAAWWLPDLQAGWHKRRYARELGELVDSLERAQPALDRRLELAALMPPTETTS